MGTAVSNADGLELKLAGTTAHWVSEVCAIQAIGQSPPPLSHHRQLQRGYMWEDLTERERRFESKLLKGNTCENENSGKVGEGRGKESDVQGL